MNHVHSHTLLSSTNLVILAAKQAANKPTKDVDLHYTNTEINKALKRTALSKLESQYKERATEKHWNLGFADNPVCPPMNKRHCQVFNRIRCGNLKMHYWKPRCMCNEKLSVDHILTCQTLLEEMPELTEQLRFYHLPYCRENVFRPHIEAGWTLVHVVHFFNRSNSQDRPRVKKHYYVHVTAKVKVN